MTHKLAGIGFLMLVTMAAGRAGESFEVSWNDLCKTADHRRLVLTGENGEVVNGYCVSVDVTAISVRTDENKVIKIARAGLAKVQVHRTQGGNELAKLGKGMGRTFRDGLNMLFSPAAPAGLVVLPVTAAWGAVAAPFCAIGDLVHKVAGKQEVTVK